MNSKVYILTYKNKIKIKVTYLETKTSK